LRAEISTRTGLERGLFYWLGPRIRGLHCN
jgi:hypothetical protein